MNSLVIDCFNFTMGAYALANNTGNAEKNFLPILRTQLVSLMNQYKGYDKYAVWDTAGGTTFRKEKNSSYKANRDHSAFDFKAIRGSSSLYEELGFKNLSVPQCEADDAIFVLCKKLKEKKPNDKVIIISRDRDMIQVVQQGYADGIWDNVKKGYIDIPYYSIVDFKSIVGDRSDGVSGVPRIGEKGAIKVLTGLITLNEKQKQIFESCKDIIDIRRNPNLPKIEEFITEWFSSKN